MIGSTSKITIPEKPCDINQTQMDWLRLLTSSSSSKVEDHVCPINTRDQGCQLFLKPETIWKKY